MKENKIIAVMQKYGAQIPDEKSMELRKYLQGTTETGLDILLSTPVKKRKGVTLALSLLLSGVGADRFYLGDIGLGVLKLVSSVVISLIGLIPVVGTILGVILGIARFIWTVADWFLTYSKAKEINYQNILGIVMLNKDPSGVVTTAVTPSQVKEKLTVLDAQKIMGDFILGVKLNGKTEEHEYGVTFSTEIDMYGKQVALNVKINVKNNSANVACNFGRLKDNADVQGWINEFNYHQSGKDIKLGAKVYQPENVLVISHDYNFWGAGDLKEELFKILESVISIDERFLQAFCNATI